VCVCGGRGGGVCCVCCAGKLLIDFSAFLHVGAAAALHLLPRLHDFMQDNLEPIVSANPEIL